MINIERDRDMVVFRKSKRPNREVGHLPVEVFKLAMDSVQEMVSVTHLKAVTTISLNQTWDLLITCYWGVNDGKPLIELRKLASKQITEFVGWQP